MQKLERIERIELSPTRWQRIVLPLAPYPQNLVAIDGTGNPLYPQSPKDIVTPPTFRFDSATSLKGFRDRLGTTQELLQSHFFILEG